MHRADSSLVNESPPHHDTNVYSDQKRKAIPNRIRYIEEKIDTYDITKDSLTKMWIPIFTGSNQW